MILDSTMIMTFMQCPRKMFFRYRKHWSPNESSIHLEFGTAWHLAKEHLLWNPTDIEGAMRLFLDHYRKHYPQSSDAANAPKAPGNALDALISYARRDFHGRKILHTEVAGVVPLADDLQVAFKMDAVVEDANGGIWVIDHKTGSRLTAGWADSWLVSPQLCIYTHVLEHYYGQDRVKGARVEGTIFRKNDHEHIDVPVTKTAAGASPLFWSILNTVDYIKWNIAEEEATSPDDPLLAAWPMRPNACFDYARQCPYFGYCAFCGNPLGRQCPAEFSEVVWSPLDKLADRKTMNEPPQEAV